MATHLNKQPPEKTDWREDGSLDVVSVFPTIQGEGPYAGCPAVFVRLAGCDLQCSLCDTLYTIGRNRYSTEDLIFRTIESGNGGQKLIVITGGEPFRQNIGPFCRRLQSDYNLTVQIETNGTLPIPNLPNVKRIYGTIICSPKTSKIHGSVLRHADAWKYILDADHIDRDGLPSQSLGMHQRPARPPVGTSPLNVYVQPLDSGSVIENQRHADAALATCQKYGYRLSLQLHKILEMP